MSGRVSAEELAEVLATVERVKRERAEWKAGLREQRKWFATFKAKEGDDWKRRERAELATFRVLRDLREFGTSISPDDLAYALATGYDHVATKLRADLAECFELLEPFRAVVVPAASGGES